MLSHQKDLFALAENVTYLNGAYMSPQLRSVEKIGIENLKRKSEPYTISESDFFSKKIISSANPCFFREFFSQMSKSFCFADLNLNLLRITNLYF